MSLSDEIEYSRKKIDSDGYDMSIGEVMNLYKEGELTISPPYQRLFRWELTQKTRFIESLLIGIPIPPIFVFQNEDGVWELIDGLQRLSTIFEFAGILKDADGVLKPSSILEGTSYLPSLAEKKWEDIDQQHNSIGKLLQIEIKRSRIRVEILKKESDINAKYELFQRLNTGGTSLSEQEVRNCVSVMLAPNVYAWYVKCSSNIDFINTISQTDDAIEKQASVELALRFFAFRHYDYVPGKDIHEYLDDVNVKICTSEKINLDAEYIVFERVFSILNRVLSDRAFKKWDGFNFKGKFLISLYEMITYGIQYNLDEIENLGSEDTIDQFIEEKVKSLSSFDEFIKYSGAGVRGTTRVANLIPMARSYFRP